MKKLLCILSVFALLSLTTLPVYATDNTGMNLTVTTNVINYPNFTISIPATIPLGNLERTETSTIASKEFSVTVSGTETLSSQKVEVFVSSESGDFKLYCGSDALDFEIYNQATGGTPLQSGALFATFTADREQKGRIEVDRADIRVAGSYAGTVRFIVKVSES